MDAPQNLPWLITAISALGNIAQLVTGWRKSDSDADKSDAETDAIRQQIEMDALQQVRELQAWMREQSVEIRAENTELRTRLESLEDSFEDLGRQLEKERIAWETERAGLLRRLTDMEDENRAWRMNI